MHDAIIKDLLKILKKEYIKNEFDVLSKIVIDFILFKMKPYLLSIIIFFIFIFFMVLVNLIFTIKTFYKNNK